MIDTVPDRAALAKLDVASAEDGKRLLWTLALPVAVASGWLGLYLAHALVAFLKANPQPLFGIVKVEWLTGTVSLGLLVGFAREALHFLVELPAILRPADYSKAVGNALKAFFLVFSIVLAFRSFAAQPPTLSLLPAYPVYLQEGQTAPLAILPIYYDNASRDEATAWAAGVDVTPESELLLKALVAQLAERCGGGEAGAAFHLRTAGSASSKEFDKMTLQASARENVEVTNQRTSRAAGSLRKLVEGLPGFTITEQPKFSTYDQLVIRRPYIDRIATTAPMDSVEALNRRVDVEIIEAGTCTTKQVLLERLTAR